MSELDVTLAGKSLSDYTNTQLRLALGAVLYTNTAEMWQKYLNQQGYTGSVSDMLQRYYVDRNVPNQFRNYISAGIYLNANSSDPNFASVSALLHFNGVNGSTTYTDVKGATWTGFDSVQISTANSKFGGASLLLSNGRVSAPDSDSYNFGSGDFTIEGWFYETASGAIRQIIGQHTTAPGQTADCSFLVLSDTAKLTFQVFVGGTLYTAANPATHALNAWHHFAAVRTGNTIKTFLNGTEVASQAITGTINNSAQPLVIGVIMNAGAPDAGNYYFNGNIDDIRITKGVARYTANFTPPTSAFPDA